MSRPEPRSYKPTDQELRSILGDARTVAVVGLSSKPWRDSYEVAEYLQGKGYRIIPVNPKETEGLGERAYPTPPDVPHPVDALGVFRRPEAPVASAKHALA